MLFLFLVKFLKSYGNNGLADHRRNVVVFLNSKVALFDCVSVYMSGAA